MDQKSLGKQPESPQHRLVHSIADVTKIIGLGRSFVYEEIKEGRLRVRKAGRRSLIFDADLKAWLQALPEKSNLA
jgi:excisionase family DNA binding protein